MHNPFDFFDEIYCVSLPESKDRWHNVMQQFHKVGISSRVQRISARKPNPLAFNNYLDNSFNPGKKYPTASMVGCSLSHLKALMRVSSTSNNVLIFEDDIVFADDASEQLRTAILELPTTWCVFYLGGIPAEKTNQHSNSLISVRQFWGSYAYALNKNAIRRMRDIVVDNLSTCSYDYQLSNPAFTADHYERYCAYPTICQCSPGYSLIEERFVDWEDDSKVKENWNLYKP